MTAADGSIFTPQVLAYVQQVVDAAPPLTPEQRAVITTALRPPRGSAARREAGVSLARLRARPGVAAAAS